MAIKQNYGIKYPFSMNNDDNVYLDTNDTITEAVTSKVLHVLFTPKGQKLRDPEFGTDLIQFIFQPTDDITYTGLIGEIQTTIKRYVPYVDFNSFQVVPDEKDENGRIVLISYSITKGNKKETVTTGVKIA